MNKRTKMQEKRANAQRLYIHSGMLQQDIARILSVSEKTLSLWKNADGWEKQRAAVTTTKEKELARLYSQLAALNNAIGEREEGKRFPTSSEADVQSKLSASIAKLEGDMGLSATVNVFMSFTNWLRAHADLSVAKQFAELSNRYIQSLV